MTGPEHYREAERLIAIDDLHEPPTRGNIALAQVHATLALAAASALGNNEWMDDIEATGRCCCAGCIGMGPCDRANSEDDDRERCENCAGTGTDSTLVTTDPHPIYMPHPCGYCEPVRP